MIKNSFNELILIKKIITWLLGPGTDKPEVNTLNYLEQVANGVVKCVLVGFAFATDVEGAMVLEPASILTSSNSLSSFSIVFII